MLILKMIMLIRESGLKKKVEEIEQGRLVSKAKI